MQLRLGGVRSEPHDGVALVGVRANLSANGVEGNLEGDLSPGKERASGHRQRWREVTDPSRDQGLEVERTAQEACESMSLRAPNVTSRRQQHRGDAIRLLVGGILRGVVRLEGCGEDLEDGDVDQRHTTAEIQRTPGPVAGCNKPASAMVEKAVEVVRDRADGTGLSDGFRWPMWSRPSGRIHGSGHLA